MRAFIVVLLSVLTAPNALGAQHRVEWATADSITSVDQARIGLHIYAWRDFMPGRQDEVNGSDLMVNLRIASRDTVLPPEFTVDSAWVRSSAGLWATAPTAETRPELRNGLDLMLRGGPKWATGEDVEVLVRLRLRSGMVYYLLAHGRLHETS